VASSLLAAAAISSRQIVEAWRINWTRRWCRRRRIWTRRRAAGSVILSGSCKLHDTLIQVHSGAGAPNEVSAIQILDVLLWMAFRKRW